MTTDKLDGMAKAVPVDGVASYDLEFSFCSLVTDKAQYQTMVKSMVDAGFEQGCSEFLYFDNTTNSAGDGFSGLNRLANAARGQYVVFCHQDLLAIDGPDRLRQILGELSKTDPNWAVLGNAGVRDGARFMFLNERGTVFAATSRETAQRVDSLDEDFILLRQDARLGFSSDLDGFHLYGTDLVVQANVRGLNAYAVDFRVEHLGKGQIDQSFRESCDRFEDKYARAFAARTLSTTCAALDIGTLEGKGRKRRHRDFERGLEFVRPSKKLKKVIRSGLSGHTVDLDGISFLYPKDVTYAAYHALSKGFYEQPERNLMTQFLPPDLPVVELGGSYGIVTGLINRKLNQNVKQVVVEANPKLLELCENNARRGGDDRKLEIVNSAIDYSGADSITFNVTAGTHDSHVVESWRSASVDDSITAPTITLSQLLAKQGIDGPYALVCDIEGAEFDLIANDIDGLTQCQVMIVELHPSVFYERGETVSSFLRNLDLAGFEVLANEATVIAACKKPT